MEVPVSNKRLSSNRLSPLPLDWETQASFEAYGYASEDINDLFVLSFS